MNLQLLLEKWKIKADVNLLLSMWNESQRFYHNLDHLNKLLDDINEKYGHLSSEKELDKLNLTALFHDIVYNPQSKTNEEDSADFFIKLCSDKSNSDIQDIKQAILDTKTHESTSDLSDKFNKLDMSVVEGNYDSLLEWEQGISQEYAFVGPEAYKEGRLKFLESLLDNYNHNAGNLLKLIEHVRES